MAGNEARTMEARGAERREIEKGVRNGRPAFIKRRRSASHVYRIEFSSVSVSVAVIGVLDAVMGNSDRGDGQ